MALIDEVRSFAREFINKPSARTAERKSQIKEVTRQLTGRHLAQGCNTCYIEALFKILTLTSMSKYEMRKGYVAQFNIPFKGVKSFTNVQITDEIAAEYLRRYPERIVYFTKVPGAPPKPAVAAAIKIVNKPVKTEKVKVEPEAPAVKIDNQPEDINDDLASVKPNQVIADALGEEKPKPKARPKSKAKPKTAKSSD